MDILKNEDARAMMHALLASAHCLAHTTSEIGIWSAGLQTGLELAMSFARLHVPLTLDEVSSARQDIPEPQMLLVLMRTLKNMYDDWRREAVICETSLGEAFAHYESLIATLLGG